MPKSPWTNKNSKITEEWIMNIAIRLAKPDDALDMAEVYASSWEAAYRNIIPMKFIKEKNAACAAAFQRVITTGNTTHYVIQVDGKTVGVMCVAPPQDDDVGDDFYELHGLYLHPDYYRKGIGTKAMEFAFEKARNLGKRFMTLWVFKENIDAIKFYEKFGFTTDGKTKTYNCGKIMECIRIRKALL
jgi:GNAT superfamily N-acetyltransferase